MTAERRRLRSREVALVSVPLLAFAFGACGGNNTAYCVDRNDRIVENRYCDQTAFNGTPGYFWYYGGHASGGHYVTGTRLASGSRVASTNIAENVKRGGFGSSGHSSSGIGHSTGGHSSGG